MPVCVPCCGIGVRHIQYISFALMITIEYWIQSITLKTFLHKVTSDADSIIGKKGNKRPTVESFTPEQIANIQAISYSVFAIGRLVSGFVALKITNKYTLVCLCLVEFFGATTCYWLALSMGYHGVLGCMAFIAFTRSFHWTLTMNILAKWMPPTEFTTANAVIVVMREAFSLMFNFFMTTISFDTTRKVLLVVMCLYFLWVAIFVVIGADGPETSFLLSKAEFHYLARHIGPRKKTKCSSRAPWKSIFGTAFLYGWLIADFGRECAVTTIADGFFVSLGHMKVIPISGIQAVTGVFYICILIMSVVCDRLISKEILRPSQVRKIYSSVGSCGLSISMILSAYSRKQTVKFGFLICGNLFCCIVAIGQPVALFDVSPNYAASIFAAFTFIRCIMYAGRTFVDLKLSAFPLNDRTFDDGFFRYGFVVFMTNLIFLLSGDIERKPFDTYDTVDWTKESIISYP